MDITLNQPLEVAFYFVEIHIHWPECVLNQGKNELAKKIR